MILILGLVRLLVADRVRLSKLRRKLLHSSRSLWLHLAQPVKMFTHRRHIDDFCVELVVDDAVILAMAPLADRFGLLLEQMHGLASDL